MVAAGGLHGGERTERARPSTKVARYDPDIGPNVLLIVMDTARADAFEPYGAASGATPAVTQLASIGGFQRYAYAPACWTVPSHASMLTGLLPRDVGLGQAPDGPVGVRPVMESLANHLLPERLRRAGWHTAGVSANHWIAEHSGFATGFDDWRQVVSGRSNRFYGSGLRHRLAWDFQGVRAHTDDGAAEAEGVIREWIANGRQRFFWFVNLIECHSPYLPPRPGNDLSTLQRLRAAEEARRYLTFLGILRACAGGFDIPDGALERMRHLYAQSVRMMDDWLARVLDAMDASGLLDDTIVIVTSDHGENLGEGRLIGHAFSLDDRLIRVPFVSSHPLADRDHVLNLADVPRLVADAVGLEEHPWGDGELRSGVAVAQLDPFASPDDPRVAKFVGEWGLGDEGVHRMTTGATAATNGELKLVRRGQEELLYDLTVDPLELHPRSVSGTEELRGVEALRAAVDAATDPRPVPGLVDTAPPRPPVSEEELERIEQQMKLLGYM
jgi:arylsulfatase A-like enzyme